MFILKTNKIHVDFQYNVCYDFENTRYSLWNYITQGKIFIKIVEEWFENNVNERLINLLVACIGIVLVITGVLFGFSDNETVQAILISIGTSLIASAVVSFLASIYIFKHKREKEITDVWRLVSIKDNRSEMNMEVHKRLNTAENQLDIIGYGMKSFRESRDELIRSRIQKGLKIRIITVDPNCDFLKQRDIDENKLEGSTSNSINQLYDWVNNLNNEYGKSVEIRFCRTLPTEVYFRVDDYIYVGPYQCGKESQQTITMEYHSKGIGFEYYNSYFEKLWNDGNFCFENIA